MYILLLLVCLIYFYESNGETKHCVNCRHFIPYKNNKITSLGTCKLFGNKVNSSKTHTDKIIYNFADHCRNDEHLCSKEGWLYEDNIIIVKNNQDKAKEKFIYYYRILQIIKENW
jgi:hypothetical protein